jgi:hypothetical protein
VGAPPAAHTHARYARRPRARAYLAGGQLAPRRVTRVVRRVTRGAHLARLGGGHVALDLARGTAGARAAAVCVGCMHAGRARGAQANGWA